MVIADAEPLIHMSFCSDNGILARLSGSFAPYSFSALAGHYDDEGVIYLRQRVVNVIQSGCRVVSHLRDDFGMPFQSRCIRKLAGLPDHLVRSEQERQRNRETERLSCLEVNHQLELHDLLHRQVTRFGPFKSLSRRVGTRHHASAMFRRIVPDATTPAAYWEEAAVLWEM